MKKLALLGMLLVGCARVQTGEIGIKKDVFGQVDDTPLVNTVEVTILDSVIVVDGTQVRVLAEGIKAKDLDGVLFAGIDVQATYNTRPLGAVAFYKATREVDCIKEPNEAFCDYVLGFSLLKQELINATVKAFSKFKASDVNRNKTAIEDEVRKILIEKLDARYKDVFEITNININSAQLDPTVERVLQAQAILDSENRLLGAKTQLQKQANELLKAELVEMRAIANNAGISVTDLMKYRNEKDRNKVLSELAKNAPQTQIQIKE